MSVKQRDRDKVFCPKCATEQPRKAEPHAVYFCEVCKLGFDDDPNEGIGSHGWKPETRMMRRERYR